MHLRTIGLTWALLFCLSAPASGRTPRVQGAGEVKTGWRTPVRSVAVDSAGMVLAAGGDTGEIVIYDLAKQRIRLRLSARGRVTCLAITPDGKHLAVGWKGSYVELVSLATGRSVRRFGPLAGWPLGLAFSPKGDRLAVAGRAQRIALYDVASGRAQGTLAGHTSWVNAVAFSPDGSRVAGAGWDHAVRVWDVAQRKLVTSGFGHRFALNSVTFTQDGKRVITASDDQTLRVFHARTGTALKRVPGPAITCLARAGTSARLVAGTYNGRLLLLREQQMHPRRIQPAHRGAVLTVAVTANGRLAVTGGRDGRVRMWRIR